MKERKAYLITKLLKLMSSPIAWKLCLFVLFMLFSLFLVDFSSFAELDLKINEIMYAPSAYLGSNNEWIEIYNAGNVSLNLSSCYLDDKTFSKAEFNPQEYLVLVKSSDDFQKFYNFSFVPISVSLSLKNDADTINFSCKNSSFSYAHIFSYDQSIGGYRNNFTLERREENTWSEGFVELGTPGRENSIFNFSSDYSSLIINEIFPDPFGDDDLLKPLGEWLELYNLGKKSVQVGGLILRDNDDENELYIAQNKVINEDLIINPGEFLVIYRDSDSDFALNNYGYERVRLFNFEPTSNGIKEKLLQEVSYTGSTSGMSWSNVLGNLYLTPPTPGKKNEIVSDCDWLLQLDINNSIYHSKDFDFEITASRFYGLPLNISVQGLIENEYGEAVKEYSPWKNELIDDQETRDYSPNLKPGIYQISFWYANLSCNDTDESDNKVSRLLAINNYYQAYQNDLSIEHIYLGSDNKAKWAQQVPVKINLYKGNSSSTVLEIWAEKEGKLVSPKSKFNAYEEFKNYTFTLPLQLEPNCAHELVQDGQVKLIAEGFGKRVEDSFLVSGIDEDICKDYGDYIEKQEKEASALDKKIHPAYNIAESPSSATTGSVFSIRVDIFNEKGSHKYQVWSYVYRGSKCYSCQTDTNIKEKSEEEYDIRMRNLQRLNLNEGELGLANMLLKLDSKMEEGEYKLKVKIKKDEQKTLKELTQAIYIVSENGNDLEDANNNLSNKRILQQSSQEEDLLVGKVDTGTHFNIPLAVSSSSGNGLVVYESNQEKSRKLMPYFLVVSVILVIIISFIKK